MRGEKKENMRIMETKEMNPVKGDVSDSELNAGVVNLTQPQK